jgi:hypothetical protein
MMQPTTLPRPQKLENTDFHAQLINFENDQYHVAHERNLEEKTSCHIFNKKGKKRLRSAMIGTGTPRIR